MVKVTREDPTLIKLKRKAYAAQARMRRVNANPSSTDGEISAAHGAYNAAFNAGMEYVNR